MKCRCVILERVPHKSKLFIECAFRGICFHEAPTKQGLEGILPQKCIFSILDLDDYLTSSSEYAFLRSIIDVIETKEKLAFHRSHSFWFQVLVGVQSAATQPVFEKTKQIQLKSPHWFTFTRYSKTVLRHFNGYNIYLRKRDGNRSIFSNLILIQCCAIIRNLPLMKKHQLRSGKHICQWNRFNVFLHMRDLENTVISSTTEWISQRCMNRKDA